MNGNMWTHHRDADTGYKYTNLVHRHVVGENVHSKSLHCLIYGLRWNLWKCICSGDWDEQKCLKKDWFARACPSHGLWSGVMNGPVYVSVQYEWLRDWHWALTGSFFPGGRNVTATGTRISNIVIIVMTFDLPSYRRGDTECGDHKCMVQINVHTHYVMCLKLHKGERFSVQKFKTIVQS